MADGSMCVSLCEQSGGLAELLLIALVGARALWSEAKKRRLAAENAGLKEEKKSLENKVEVLSMRPPFSLLMRDPPSFEIRPSTPEPETEPERKSEPDPATGT